MSQYELLGLPLLHAGKVRELYGLPDSGDLLMVATDNISAFDHVLDTQIPGKGAVLTQLSLWWFDQLAGIVDNHVVSTRVPAAVAGRAIVAERLDMVPVECVARGYLTGSGWAEYRDSGTVCGIPLPAGLRDGDQLPEPIFTPAIKAPVGEHDENVSFETIVELHGEELAARLRELTLAIYTRAERIARERGIILADTKFEFGLRPDGTLVLADEVLTPDSSRFWDADSWRPGQATPSFDKQYVRDWLAHSSGWDKSTGAPPPALPPEVVETTRRRYLEAFERLTGREFRYAKPMATVVVNVMPKPEILDPQGKAVTGALTRLGFKGLSVRQGKRFEVSVDGDVTDEVLAKISDAAEKLLANTVIETFDVVVEG
ncbi:MAG: phosphoribosylaminoimidazolesuccinocarboxamide synthase [Propionibacteriaceae bacterium]|nr:phosphoribosylaminoimidazolesuccinocarboxamide synthase [Propionibacteriaceae bacterium]